MKFIDLKAENELFKKEIEKETNKVCASGCYLMGEQMERLEDTFRSLTGKKEAIAVGNGTDALILAIRSVWHKDIPVIIPNFGAYPTAVAVRNITSNIHFVDVDDNFTIDANKLPGDVKDGIIIPVHLFGNYCWMHKINEYAEANNHIVIEDSAQALPTIANTESFFTCFSFYPTKPIASMGDGGMICTDNPGRAEYIRALRFYGQNKGKVEHIGINSRMDEWQCAVVNAKLSKNGFKHWEMTEKRKKIAKRYHRIIRREEILNCCQHQFPLMFEKRDEVIIPELNKCKIPFMIHYPHHISEMPAFADIKSEVGFRVAQKIISLPVHPFLTESEIQRVEEFLNDHKQYEWNPVKKTEG